MQSTLNCSNCKRTDGVLVAIGVDAAVGDRAEQVVHDAEEGVSGHHAVQPAHEHRHAGSGGSRLLVRVVAVAQHPRDYLFCLLLSVQVIFYL